MTHLIEKTPNVVGGDACIRENAHRCLDVGAARGSLGFPDFEIRARYQPPLTQADLDAAWQYYEKHRDEIDQAIRAHEEA